MIVTDQKAIGLQIRQVLAVFNNREYNNRHSFPFHLMASATFPVRRYAAELLGTFLLTFAVSASLNLDYAVPTPLIAALTLMTAVYVIGSVSGAHINPAVTLGQFSIKTITFRDAACYIIAQLLGAFLASLLLTNMVDPRILQVGPTAEGVIGELIGTFVLALGVTMVVKGRVVDAAAGLAVGFSLFVGIMVASAGSLGVINPAVALGLGLFDPTQSGALGSNALVYALVPLVGGFLGSQAAAWFAAGKK